MMETDFEGLAVADLGSRICERVVPNILSHSHFLLYSR